MLRFQGIFSGIPTLARPSSVHSNTTTLVAQQKRFARRTVGKPRPRAALDPDGEPIINSVKLEKVYRWRPEQIEAYRTYVRKMAEQVKHIPEGERMPALQRFVDEYINGIWGHYVASVRIKARANRKRRLKKRAITKTARKMMFWQRVQDFKEERENNIREEKLREELAERRAQRMVEKKALSRQKQEYWGRVLGDWHAENNKLKALKKEYMLARENVYAKSRKEFLEALNLETLKFKETPDECKYMRFAFGYGVQFPFNETNYS